MNDPEQVTEIDMVSDLVCPWCWVGLRNLMWATHNANNQKFRITFRPFFLDGNLPEEGVDYQTYMERKFPDKTKRAAGVSALMEAGQKVGIDFQFGKIKKRPHTANAHRLILWAQGQNLGLYAKEALFKAFFTDGEDIGTHGVLRTIAGSIGMDAELVDKLLAGDQDKERISEEVGVFQKMGVGSVPTFIVDRKAGISGALPPDDLIGFIQKNAN